MKWSSVGGRVHNNSSRTLVVAFDNPYESDGWAYRVLGPGKSTDFFEDIDGFRAVDYQQTLVLVELLNVTYIPDWLKIRNLHTAEVKDGETPNHLIVNIKWRSPTVMISPVRKSNDDFGWSDTEKTFLSPY